MRTPSEDRVIRATYDAVAADYARLIPDMSLEAPLDRAVLAAFVAMAEGSGLIAEVGCGAGRVTAHLADAGLSMMGLDLSPRMTALARSARPDLPYVVAHAGALPVRDAVFGGLVAWYSLINLAPDRLEAVLRELARATRAGAALLLAFQSGDGERLDRSTAYGHQLPMTYYRHRVQDVAEAVVAAGFALYATVRREPVLAHETTPQAFVLAQRRGGPAAPSGRLEP